jgi:hypothetical protein
MIEFMYPRLKALRDGDVCTPFHPTDADPKNPGLNRAMTIEEVRELFDEILEGFEIHLRLEGGASGIKEENEKVRRALCLFGEWYCDFWF